jgi:hypothetical protein
MSPIPLEMSGKIDIKPVLTPINGRTIRLTGAVARYNKSVDELGNIIELSADSEHGPIVFKIGDVVRNKPKASPYKINCIHPVFNSEMLLGYDFSVAPQTKSSIFVAPFLGGTRRLFLWDKFFVNAFIGTADHPDTICLLYRFSGDTLFTKFEAALEAFKSFRCKFDPDPYHVMFVFDIPEGTTSSFMAFKESKYSEIGEIMKLKILDYHGFTMEGHTAQILFKSKSLKDKLEQELEFTLPADAELCSRLELTEEIFDAEYYKINKSKIDV